jgi:formate dehydrogenase subunit gamma
MPRLGEWDQGRAREIIAANGTLEGPVLPILHALLDEFGHIPEEAIALVASELNLSRAEIHGTGQLLP